MTFRVASFLQERFSWLSLTFPGFPNYNFIDPCLMSLLTLKWRFPSPPPSPMTSHSGKCPWDLEKFRNLASYRGVFFHTYSFYPSQFFIFLSYFFASVKITRSHLYDFFPPLLSARNMEEIWRNMSKVWRNVSIYLICI